ncbi:MAG: hypothetical protein OEY93_06250 [Anaerolineae bacterium]|nr:hypothetical protein [Anaerolineae bacterium]
MQKRYNSPQAKMYVIAFLFVFAIGGIDPVAVNASQSQWTKNTYLSTSSVVASIDGCIPLPPDYVCEEIPRIKLKYQAQKNSREFERIKIKIGVDAFPCEKEVCYVNLGPTSNEGARIEFWAVQKGNVQTDHYWLKYRVLDISPPDNPAKAAWKVEIISLRLINSEAPDYYHIWDMLPPLTNIPAWLRTPRVVDALATQNLYYYLSAKLIQFKLADPGDCPAGGVNLNGYATACGMEKTKEEVYSWQNRFDRSILRVARQTEVPAQLLKNFFARESQFWPADYGEVAEYGIGHITEPGADTLLLWNPNYYREICHMYAGDSSPYCINGFGELEETHQAALRGIVLDQASAYCPECPTKLYLEDIERNIRVFAWALQAKAAQAGQIVHNVTGKPPSLVSSYEDMWKFTLINYNVGPNCLYNSLKAVWGAGNPLTWENTAPQIKDFCGRSVKYVNDISNNQ